MNYAMEVVSPRFLCAQDVATLSETTLVHRRPCRWFSWFAAWAQHETLRMVLALWKCGKNHLIVWSEHPQPSKRRGCCSIFWASRSKQKHHQFAKKCIGWKAVTRFFCWEKRPSWEKGPPEARFVCRPAQKMPGSTIQCQSLKPPKSRRTTMRLEDSDWPVKMALVGKCHWVLIGTVLGMFDPLPNNIGMLRCPKPAGFIRCVWCGDRYR